MGIGDEQLSDSEEDSPLPRRNQAAKATTDIGRTASLMVSSSKSVAKPTAKPSTRTRIIAKSTAAAEVVAATAAADHAVPAPKPSSGHRVESYDDWQANRIMWESHDAPQIDRPQPSKRAVSAPVLMPKLVIPAGRPTSRKQ